MGLVGAPSSVSIGILAPGVDGRPIGFALFLGGPTRTIAAMVRNVRLVVAYDGTDFHGWQNQLGLRTVQGTVEQAIRRAVRHQINLIGSGRTDTGVHAAAHASCFLTNSPLDPVRLRHSIGSRLPKDVSILHLGDAHRAFHATQSATTKLYRYRIHNDRGRPVEHHTQRQTYHYWEPLDVDQMRRGASHFVGEMDFAAMAGSGEPRMSTIRRVVRCDVHRHLDEIRVDVEGTGFLYRQVRNMVGTLINVGRGHWPPERVADILASRDRASAGPTAPARGLCLQWVRYPAELLRADPDDGVDDARFGDDVTFHPLSQDEIAERSVPDAAKPAIEADRRDGNDSGIGGPP